MPDGTLIITRSGRSRWRDSLVVAVMAAAAGVAILVTLGIVMSLVFETILFLKKIPLSNFLFGLEWSPQTAIRSDQVGAEGSFGVLPLINGTLLISAIAMAVATPLGLTSAIYLSEYASKRARDWVKPALEILAGIPTVVYGFFAALTVAPFIRMTGGQFGLRSRLGKRACLRDIVMGIMIVPLISSLSDDVINAVPQSLRDASLGMGATQSETIRKRGACPPRCPALPDRLLLGHLARHW